MRRGRGENKVAKQMRSGLRKGKQKESTWDATGMEKRILSVHHPSTLVHWWVVIGHLSSVENAVS